MKDYGLEKCKIRGQLDRGKKEPEFAVNRYTEQNTITKATEKTAVESWRAGELNINELLAFNVVCCVLIILVHYG